MARLEHMTHAVVEGRQDARALLVRGLQMVLAETESLSHKLADTTFVTDEATRAWQRAATDAAGGFCAGLYGMLRVLESEQTNREALLQALAQTVQAEKKVRLIFAQVNAIHQQAVADASRVECSHCGHRSAPGHDTCDNCATILSPMNGESGAESVFLRRLDHLLGNLDSQDGVQMALEFLQNLESLYVLGGRQLDTMLTLAARDHEATQYTLDLRVRMEVIRVMVDAVRQAVLQGELSALHEFAPWLAEQFDGMLQLKERVVAACG